MEAEVGEEVHAVIHIYVSYQAIHLAGVLAVKEQANGVACCSGNGHIVGIVCLIVASEGAVGIVVIYRREWAVGCTSPDCRLVGKAVLVDCSLSIDVKAQIIVEERRRERDASCVASGIVGLEDTILIVVAERHTEREILGYAAGNAQVVVGSECCLVDFIIPVGVIAGVDKGFLLVGAKLVHDGCHIVGAEHVGYLCAGLKRVGGLEIHLYTVVATAFLGSDNNYTVRCTRTIDGCR